MVWRRSLTSWRGIGFLLGAVAVSVSLSGCSGNRAIDRQAAAALPKLQIVSVPGNAPAFRGDRVEWYVEVVDKKLNLGTMTCQWSFGDGVAAPLQRVTGPMLMEDGRLLLDHAYAEPGEFTLTFSAVAPWGETFSAESKALIHHPYEPWLVSAAAGALSHADVPVTETYSTLKGLAGSRFASAVHLGEALHQYLQIVAYEGNGNSLAVPPQRRLYLADRVIWSSEWLKLNVGDESLSQADVRLALTNCIAELSRPFVDAALAFDEVLRLDPKASITDALRQCEERLASERNTYSPGVQTASTSGLTGMYTCGEVPCPVELQPGESIQRAVDQASDGAVICLRDGIWRENLVITKSVTLRGCGENRGTVTIAGQADGPILTVEGDTSTHVSIENLTIGYGMDPDPSLGYSLRKNWFEGYGVIAGGSASVALGGVALLHNSVGLVARDSARVTVGRMSSASLNCIGILALDSASVLVSNATVLLNRWHGYWSPRNPLLAAPGEALHFEDVFVQLSGMTTGVAWGCGLVVCESASAIVVDSSFPDNTNGITFADSGEGLVLDTNVTRSEYTGITLHDSSQASVVGCRIWLCGGTGVGVGNSGMNTGGSADLTLRGCSMSENGSGVWIYSGASVSGESNEITTNSNYDLYPAQPSAVWPDGFLRSDSTLTGFLGFSGSRCQGDRGFDCSGSVSGTVVVPRW